MKKLSQIAILLVTVLFPLAAVAEDHWLSFVNVFVEVVLIMATIYVIVGWIVNKYRNSYVVKTQMTILDRGFALGAIFFLMFINGYRHSYLLLFLVPLSDASLLISLCKKFDCHKLYKCKLDKWTIISLLLIGFNLVAVFLYGYEKITWGRLFFFVSGVFCTLLSTLILIGMKNDCLKQRPVFSFMPIAVSVALCTWQIREDVDTWQYALCVGMAICIAILIEINWLLSKT